MRKNISGKQVQGGRGLQCFITEIENAFLKINHKLTSIGRGRATNEQRNGKIRLAEMMRRECGISSLLWV